MNSRSTHAVNLLSSGMVLVRLTCVSPLPEKSSLFPFSESVSVQIWRWEKEKTNEISVRSFFFFIIFGSVVKLYNIIMSQSYANKQIVGTQKSSLFDVVMWGFFSKGLSL